MPGKKTGKFTNADGAIDKLFSQREEVKHTDDMKHTDVMKHMKHTDDIDIGNPKPNHVSKHFHERGKRSEKMMLLVDAKLKEDLLLLAKATGSKSVNDLMVTVLIEYVGQPENQARITQYRKLLEG